MTYTQNEILWERLVELVPRFVMTERRQPSGSSMIRDVIASPLGLMSSLVYMAGLVGCPPEIGIALEEEGWTVQRLALHDEDPPVIDELVERLSKSLKWNVMIDDVVDLILLSHRAAEVAWRVEGNTSAAELLVARHTRELQDKIEEVRKRRLQHLVELVPAKGTAKLARWPTRLHKRLETAGDNQQLRDEAEKTERGRWIKMLKDLLVEADTPVTKGGDLTRRYGKGRRVGTLRKHVKTWQKVSSWMKATFDLPWPIEDWQFAMYLESRADEPCGKSVPASIFKTLMFMENAAEIPVEEQICRKPALKNVVVGCLNHWAVDVRSWQTGEQVPLVVTPSLLQQAMHIELCSFLGCAKCFSSCASYWYIFLTYQSVWQPSWLSDLKAIHRALLSPSLDNVLWIDLHNIYPSALPRILPSGWSSLLSWYCVDRSVSLCLFRCLSHPDFAIKLSCQAHQLFENHELQILESYLDSFGQIEALELAANSMTTIESGYLQLMKCLST